MIGVPLFSPLNHIWRLVFGCRALLEMDDGGAPRAPLACYEEARNLIEQCVIDCVRIAASPSARATRAAKLTSDLTTAALAAAGGEVPPADSAEAPTPALLRRLALLRPETAACGKVFRSGDLGFTCSCASDPTCVLCYACFHASRAQHEGHDVSFHFAGAGGCCDCGDLEAFPAESTCCAHAPRASNAAGEPQMPPGLRMALTGIFRAIGEFAAVTAADVQKAYGCLPTLDKKGDDERFGGRWKAPPLLLPPPSSPAAHPAPAPAAKSLDEEVEESDDSDGGPPGLVSMTAARPALPTVVLSGAPVRWSVIVHNDDEHTIDQVTATFLSLPLSGGKHMSQQEAIQLTHAVDKMGYATLPCVYELPRHWEQLRSTRSKLDISGLRYSIEPIGLLAAQDVTHSLLELASKLVRGSSATARVLGEAWADAPVPANVELLVAAGPALLVRPSTATVSVLRTSGVCAVLDGAEASDCTAAAADRRAAVGASPLALTWPSPASTEPVAVTGAPGPDAVWELRFERPPGMPSPSVLLALVSCDPHSRQEIRGAVHKIIVASLGVPTFRIAFGRAFTASFPGLAFNFSRGFGTSARSILDLAVQIMTVPSVLAVGVREGGLAHSLPALLWRVLSLALTPVAFHPLCVEGRFEAFHGLILPSLGRAQRSMGQQTTVPVGFDLNSDLMKERASSARWRTSTHAFKYALRVPGYGNAVLAGGMKVQTSVSGILPAPSIGRVVPRPVMLESFDNGAPPHWTAMSSLSSLASAYLASSNLDGYTRRTGTHVESEGTEWAVAFGLSFELAVVLSALGEHVSVDASCAAPGRGGAGGDSPMALTASAGAGASPPLHPAMAAHAVSSLFAFAASATGLQRWLEGSECSARADTLSTALQHTRQHLPITTLRETAMAFQLCANTDHVRVAALRRQHLDVSTYGLVLRSWASPVSIGPVSLHPNASRLLAVVAEAVATASALIVQGRGGARRAVCVDPLVAYATSILAPSALHSEDVAALAGCASLLGDAFLRAPRPLTRGLADGAASLFVVTHDMLSPPLRAIVFAAQINANLWSRNGSESMLHMLANYSQAGKGKGHWPVAATFDRDVRAVQVALRLMTPQRGFAALLAEWELLPFFEVPVVRLTTLIRVAHADDEDIVIGPPGTIPLIHGPFVWPLPRLPPKCDRALSPSPDALEETARALRDYVLPGPRRSSRRLLAPTTGALFPSSTDSSLPPSAYPRLVEEFLRFFAVTVTCLPVLPGGAISPLDAVFADVEGPLAAEVRTAGAALDRPRTAVGEGRAAADSILAEALGSFSPVSSSRRDFLGGRVRPASSTGRRSVEGGLDHLSESLTEEEGRAALGLAEGEVVVEGGSSAALRAAANAWTLRSELVHALAAHKEGAGMPYSLIVKVFANEPGGEAGISRSDTAITGVLHSIAEYREPRAGGNTPGLYVLKDAVLCDEYDWTHPHLAYPAQHAQARTAWTTRRKAGAGVEARGGAGARPIAPAPPPASPAFLPTRRLLHSVATAHMLRLLLSDFVLATLVLPALQVGVEGQGDTTECDRLSGARVPGAHLEYVLHLAPQRTSEGVLHAALHVLTLALHAWPTRAGLGGLRAGEEWAGDVFGAALTTPHLVLPYGGPNAPVPVEGASPPSFDVSATFGAPCPPVTVTLAALTRCPPGALAPEYREGASWALATLGRCYPACAASIREELGEAGEGAVAERAAAAEGHKAMLEARKRAAQANVMSAMKRRQAAALTAFGLGDVEESESAGRSPAVESPARAAPSAPSPSEMVGVQGGGVEEGEEGLDLEGSHLLGISPLLDPSTPLSRATARVRLEALAALETPPPTPTCILCSAAAHAEGGEGRGKGGMSYLAYVEPCSLPYHASDEAAAFRALAGVHARWGAPVAEGAISPALRSEWATAMEVRGSTSGMRYDGALKPSGQAAPLIGRPSDPTIASLLAPISRTHASSLSFCGHTAHTSCLMSMMDTAVRAHAAGVQTAQDAALHLDVAAGEFSCPLCRGMCNVGVPVDGATWPLARFARGQGVGERTESLARDAKASLSTDRVRASLRLALGPLTHGLHFARSTRAMLSRTGLASLPMPSLLDGVEGLAWEAFESRPHWFGLPAGLLLCPGEAMPDGRSSTLSLHALRILSLGRALGYLPILSEGAEPGRLKIGTGADAAPIAASPACALAAGLGNNISAGRAPSDASFDPGTTKARELLEPLFAASGVPLSAADVTALAKARACTPSEVGSATLARRLLRVAAARWVYADDHADEAKADSEAAFAASSLHSPLDLLLVTLAAVRMSLTVADAEVGPQPGSRPGAVMVARHRGPFASLLGLARHVELGVHPLFADASTLGSRVLGGQPVKGPAAGALALGRGPGGGPDPPGPAPAPAPAGGPTVPFAPVGMASPPPPSLRITLMLPGHVYGQFMTTVAPALGLVGLAVTSNPPGGESPASVTIALAHSTPGLEPAAEIITALGNVEFPATGPLAQLGAGGVLPFQAAMMNHIAEAALSAAGAGGAAGVAAMGGGGGNVAVVVNVDPAGAGVAALPFNGGGVTDDEMDEDDEDGEGEYYNEDEGEFDDEGGYEDGSGGEYDEEDEEDEGMTDAEGGSEDDSFADLPALLVDAEGGSEAGSFADLPALLVGTPPPLDPVAATGGVTFDGSLGMINGSLILNNPMGLNALGGMGQAMGQALQAAFAGGPGNPAAVPGGMLDAIAVAIAAALPGGGWAAGPGMLPPGIFVAPGVEEAMKARPATGPSAVLTHAPSTLFVRLGCSPSTSAPRPHLFEPLAHHPFRAPLAALLAYGVATVLPFPVAPSTLKACTVPCPADGCCSLAIPLVLASFLGKEAWFEGRRLQPYGDATPCLSTAQRIRAQASRRDGAWMPKDAPTAAALLADALSIQPPGREPGAEVVTDRSCLRLVDVEPASLLLALSAAAPSPAHVLHCACLCFTLAAGQAAFADVPPPRALLALHSYVRSATVLLALMAVPGGEGEETTLGPAAPAFLAFVDAFGAALGPGAGGDERMEGREDRRDRMEGQALPSALVRTALPADAQSILVALAVAMPLHTRASLLPALRTAVVAAYFSCGGGATPFTTALSLGSPRAPLLPLLTAPSPAAVHSARPAPTLIPLPVEFETLYERVRGATCSACGVVPSDPALCLVCGLLLCAGSECCRSTRPTVVSRMMMRSAGECTRHARTCGGGTGIFLLLAGSGGGGGGASCLVLVRGKRAAYGPSPYVDAHGEADVGLRRGRLLHLSAARYASLTELWAKGEVAREVGRLRMAADSVVIDNHY